MDRNKNRLGWGLKTSGRSWQSTVRGNLGGKFSRSRVERHFHWRAFSILKEYVEETACFGEPQILCVGRDVINSKHR